MAEVVGEGRVTGLLRVKRLSRNDVHVSLIEKVFKKKLSFKVAVLNTVFYQF